MWGDQETGAMEFYSESVTEPKLIDFFKCETPLRKDQGSVGEQAYVYRPEKQQLGREGNGAGSLELPAAIAEGARSDLKLEPPSSIFVDFLSGNGDDPSHQLAVSRSSSDEGYKHPMAPKWIQEAVTGDQWNLITARPSLPNLALKLLSPSPTGTQASGTSPPKTPTFDMELNSRNRAQPSATTIPDHEGESSTFSADSDLRLMGSFLPDAAKLHKKGHVNGKAGSRVYRWSPKNGQKRLKIRDQSDGDDDHHDGAAMVEGSNVEFRKLREKDKDEEEKEAVVQAAASLLSLSSNEDDWQRTSSAKKVSLRRNVSSSSLAVIGEGSEAETKAPIRRGNGNGNVSSSSLAVIGEGSEGETKASSRRGNGNVSPSSSLAVVGEGSESGDGCSSGSSVLSRPSNKRRYRLVVDLLAESPKVR